jgi:glutaredoxin-like protein
MLAYLAPGAGRPLDVTVMSRDGCSFCVRAKELLRNAGIDYEELVLNRDYTDRSLRAIAASATVPQVFVNGNLIGGADALENWLSARDAA